MVETHTWKGKMPTFEEFLKESIDNEANVEEGNVADENAGDEMPEEETKATEEGTDDSTDGGEEEA